ncbi:helix-turn-helix transcriptional regulator [Bacillus swezeyi]|uniref:helix-turn-helix transcriptional regulator n=1 Tax=Bacillus swezeyi TaxID=1925020 RepID=UPI002E24A855|nr:helix-turn-helix transcriptional regulator [Bacillus swezeyi]
MKGNFNDEIENKVYEYRVLNKLSQQELADQVGVSKQTIFVMEKNKYKPSLLLAFRIAKYFNKDVTDIFTYIIREDEK